MTNEERIAKINETIPITRNLIELHRSKIVLLEKLIQALEQERTRLVKKEREDQK